jgi:hypothetical protein
MTSALSKAKSTSQDQNQQRIPGLPKAIEGQSFNNPVNVGAIRAEVKRAKKPKGLRVEEYLLDETEALREQTNLNFSEYVETALLYFNAYLGHHLSTQSNETNDAA